MVGVIEALRRGRGIGTALMQAVIDHARDRGCQRVWLVTTNDNVHAQRFYERLGFHVIEVRRDAVRAARERKPTIPTVGEGGTPITDEIVYELDLRASAG